MLCAKWRSNKYQFNSLWFDPTWARTQDLQHLRRARIGHKEKNCTCKSYILKVNPQTLFAYHIGAPDKLRICIFYAMKGYSWNIAESSVNQSKSLNCIGGDDDEVRFVLDQHVKLDFIVLAHWNNSPRVDMSLHSETLFRIRANKSLLFLFNAGSRHDIGENLLNWR
jgi:hypothetical protein